MKHYRLWKPVALIAALLFFLRPALAQEWKPIGGALQNVSGMALFEGGTSLGRMTFLIVHDNKRETEARLGMVTIEGGVPPAYTFLPWPTDNLPNDLESLTQWPGKQGNFIAVESGDKKGGGQPEPKAYHFTVDVAKRAVVIVKAFPLPKPPMGSNIEGFTLQKFGETVVAVWGHRGKGAETSVLYWATFDPTAYSFGPVKTAPLTAPWPSGDATRHLSDLKVDATGTLFVSSASDPGDDGPFGSALYLAGTFRVEGGAITFTPSPAPLLLYRFVGRKVEGFELVPGRYGGILFGTDDEGLGTFVHPTW
jgi:hypothetical protein